MIPISDHFAQAYSKLIQRYKGKPRFAALLGSYVKQIQLLEDATAAVVASRDLDTADDTRLEIIGRLVGQTRPGGTLLEQFRRFVKARILANRSDGSPEALKGVARAALGQGTYLTEGPNWQRLKPRTPIDVSAIDPTATADILRDAHAAGTAFSFEFLALPTSTEQPFRFVDGTSIVFDNLGFCTTAGAATGAVFSRIR